MKLREISRVCDTITDDVRNYDLCRKLDPIDEPLIYHVDRRIFCHNCEKRGCE